jgi:hypothetical protein
MLAAHGHAGRALASFGLRALSTGLAFAGTLADPPRRRAAGAWARGSTNPSGAFTHRQCAADVLALLDHLGVDRFKAWA